MRRSIHGFIGACLFGSTLSAGCHYHAGARVHSHSNECCAAKAPAATPVVAKACAKPKAVCAKPKPACCPSQPMVSAYSRKEYVQTTTPLPKPVAVAVVEPVKPIVVESTAELIVNMPVELGAEPTTAPAPVAVAVPEPKPVQVDTSALVPATSPITGEPAPIMQVEFEPEADKVAKTVKKPVEVAKVKTTTAIGTPRFGHAPDYSWICGEVHYSRISKAWRIRYAGLEQEDPYGGCVTPVWDVDNNQPEGMKEGQYVRVEGRMQDPETKGTAPRYRVNSMQMVDGK